MKKFMNSRRRRFLSSLTLFVMLFVLSANTLLAATTYSGLVSGGTAANTDNALTQNDVGASMTFAQNVTVSGFSFPDGETVGRVTIGMVYRRVGSVAENDDDITLRYLVNGVAGATTSNTFHPGAGNFRTLTKNVTADRAWTEADIENLTVEVVPTVVGALDPNTVEIDHLYVIVNADPVASNLAIAPVAPTDPDNLVASYNYADVDGDAEDLDPAGANTQIRWYRKLAGGANFQLQNAFNDLLTVPGGNTTVGDDWHFTVRPNDGVSYGATQTSGDVTILAGNNPPVLTPIGAQEGSENVVADFNLAANDADGNPLTFTSADLPVGAALTNAGVFTWTPTIGQAGVYNVTFVVSDNNGGSDSEIVVFTIKSAPTAANLAIAPANPIGTDALVGSYDFADVDADAELNSQIRWFKDGALQAALNDQLNVAANLTGVGEQWHFVVTPCDATTSCGVAVTSADVTIGNTAPVAANLAIAPANPIGTDALVGSYDYTDGDGDLEAGTLIRWYKNGVQQGALDNQLNVAANLTDVGEQWHFDVTPQDARGLAGVLVTSADVTIENTAPVAANMAINPGLPVTTDALTGSYDYSDGDGNAELNSQIRWYKGVLLQPALNDQLSVAANLTINGEEWHFTVTPCDALGLCGITQSSENVIIGNTSPVLDAIGDKNGSETNNLAFNITSSDVDEQDDATYSADDLPAGATLDADTGAFSWTPTFDQSGAYTPTFHVTDDSGAVDSEQITITITNVNRVPTAANLAVAPALPIGTDVLTGSYDYADPDLDIQAGSEIRWFQNNILVPALNDQLTVPANLTLVGDQWHFTVKPNDGAEFGLPQISVDVTILNTAPTAADLSIAPAAPMTDDNLVGTYTYADGDGDLEAGTLIRWYKNGVQQGALDNQTTVLAAETTRGEQWHFDVTPQDSRGLAGVTVTSADVTIGNTPPVLDPVGDKAGSENNLLAFTLSSSDADGDAPLTYGTLAALPAGAALDANTGDFTWTPTFDQANAYPVTFQVNDGNGGITSEAVTITIANTNRAPAADTLAIAPLVPIGTDDLTGSYNFTDIDGNAQGASQIRWLRNNVNIPALNDQLTVPAASTSVGDIWKFTVAPCDNDASPLCGPLLESPVVVIANTAPGAANLAITPANPITADDLVASYTYSDGDGTAEQGSEIRWYKGGVLQAAFNDLLTVPAAQTTVADEWNFTVTPCDQLGVCGNLQTSAVVTIGNTAPTAADVLATPANPISTDALVGTYTYADDDGHAELNSQIQWFQNDVAVVGLTTLNVAADQTFVGDTWKFTVTPCDALGLCGVAVTSNVITIGNSLPVLNPIGDRAGSENNLLTINLGSTDVDTDANNDIPTYSIDALPAGAALDANTGVFTWTPDFTQAGAYPVTFMVSDGNVGGTDSEPITITIANTNRAPVLDPVGNRALNELETVTIQLTATDDDGDALTLTSSELPDGATFVGGLFTWTPSAEQGTANYDMTFGVTDGMESDTENIVISVGNVDRPPELAALENQTVAENALLNFNVIANDPDGDAVTFAALNLPAGATFVDNANGTGTFNWTPDFTQAGSYLDVMFTATSGALNDSVSITVTVTNTDRAPTIDLVANQTVNEGVNLNFLVSATDLDLDAMALSASNLPGNATFVDNGNGTGTFNWTPNFTDAGVYNAVTFQAASGAPTLTGSQAITITVNNVDDPSVIDPIGDQTVNEANLLTFAVTATDSDANPITLSATNLPVGATFVDNGGGTGTFSWTPTYAQAGDYADVVFHSVSGEPAVETTQTITITVVNVNAPPVLAPLSNTSLLAGTTLTITLTGSDPDDDPVTFSAGGLPAGASMAGAVFTWTPTNSQAGDSSVTFTASSGEPVQSVSQSIIISVVGNPASGQPGTGGGTAGPSTVPPITALFTNAGGGTTVVTTTPGSVAVNEPTTEPGTTVTPPAPGSDVAFVPPTESTDTTALHPEITPGAVPTPESTATPSGPTTTPPTTPESTPSGQPGDASNVAVVTPSGEITPSNTTSGEEVATGEPTSETEVSPNAAQASVLGAGEGEPFNWKNFWISIGLVTAALSAWYAYRRSQRMPGEQENENGDEN